MRDLPFNYHDKVWATCPIGDLVFSFNGFTLKYLLEITKKKFNNSPITFLDIGCGGGKTLLYLQKIRPNWKLWGLDVSKDAISYTRRKHGRNISFINSSAEKIPVNDNYFDLIYTSDTLEHLEKLSETISEINRVLKKDGILFISVPLSNQKYTLYPLFKNIGLSQMGKMVGHIRNFDDKEIQKLVKKSGFKFIGRKYCWHPLFSLVNLGFGYFQLIIGKQVSFESGVEKSKSEFIKPILTIIKNIFAFVTYVESSVLFWFPGGKGVYVFQKK
ncbi:MAG: Methyltransferase type 11 [Candidatus Woesebacteria bacterium GW2011_GWA1_37_8]|uniref:Methyltransferase type 11 n=2 Tax=Candidatus Woeseibacteriota TaxID=1752722 RepID=A0A0G0NMT7_9BACT|nr:MAG: hypothetical protein US39_C0011G0010 [Microgenomates group bacterium GW2011_GWC1_37_12b]KKQ44812.1 MAG: Methyltransferase type 11 [Candidatus Woesebacteria bacterium GW2011_GWA1_37_8]KKQ87204.1 MAG: Methyltransferase type 11 [Candidatus Woesebacteria bacterium GW2011_GWB1_38_8b]